MKLVPSQSLRDAQAAIQAGRFEEAARRYSALVDTGWRSPEILVNYATSLKRVGRWDEALRYFEEAFRRRRMKPAGGADAVPLNSAFVVHRREQLAFLHAQGEMNAFDDEVASQLDRVARFLDRAYGAAGYGPLPADQMNVLHPWLLGCPFYEVPPIPEQILEPALTVTRLPLGQGHDCCFVIDNLLAPPALSALRRFLTVATIWSDPRPARGYIGAHLHDGLANALTRAISAALSAFVVRLIGACRWVQAWAFKYDQAATGIDFHADQADWNLNFWATATSYNLDPAGGGLRIADYKVPANWSFAEYNGSPARNARILAEQNVKILDLPYRENRAVLFPSRYLHKTQATHFATGYEARRTNLTFMADTVGRHPSSSLATHL